MTDLSKLLSELSPEQRELLQLRLKKQQAQNQASVPGGRIRRRDPGLEELPLSFSQQRLWILDQWEPGNPAYNMFGAFRLEGPLGVAALAASFNEIVRRHEVLRTRFVATGGRPRQVVSPPAPVPLPVVDLSGLEASRSQAEARRLGIGHGFRRFDLAHGPLLRLALLRLAAAEHWMLISFHHIVVDGWSISVFNRELFMTYSALQRGVPPLLPPLSVQYADYALWQREWLQGEVLDAQLAFWKELLSGAPSRIDLAFDHPRSSAQAAPVSDAPLRLGKDLSDRLRALALAEGGTLFMVLLAGFSLLLSRHAGVDDVVVGSPVANRNRSEIEGLIGFFVNTLAFRIDLRGNPTGRELLARAKRVISDAYDHQDVPFELLIDALDLERDPSHPPLVQVALSLQNLPSLAAQLAGLRIERVPLGGAAAKFDLLGVLVEEPDGVNGTLEYNRSLFEPDTVSRMAGHFSTLLEGLLSRLDQRISELPLLSAAERQQLIVDWNQTASAFPRDRTVGELFEEQAAKTPDHQAVIFRDQSLTYGELNAEADRLARRLRGLGVGPEVPVGLCADRSLDLIVGLLAIVKAGGAFVPLDPAYPAERLGYMLESSGAPIVLAQNGTLSALPEMSEGGARVLVLEELRAEESVDGAEVPALRPLPENLLYIMYTSGSTGRPKGVAVSHRSAIRLVRGVDYAHFGPGETFLQLVPLSFDPSMFEIWGALLHGARLVLFPKRVPLPEELEETIRDQGVTTLWLTTGLFHQVVDYRIEILRPLRQLLAGGEALSLPHVRRVLETFPHLRLVNGYGPTEVTCFTTCWQAQPLPADAAGVPIGGPIANTRVLVLDPHGQPVPVGVHGELYAGGEGVARCYFGRPDLTAERFVPDPLPPVGEEGARLYRTGDRVRFQPDGTLDFFGRFDNQVKVRGFRIELGEIEAAIGRHPRVGETVVLVREDTPGHRRIVAYVVPAAPLANAPAITAATLKAFVIETLPEYMVPAAWVFLESLPLTPNGKVDRRALPVPGIEREEGAEWIAPRNETEARIAEIWAEILGVDRVGVEDDFFKLGGHSLLATQLMSRVRDTFEIEVSFSRFFKAPTVAGVAAAIIEQRAAQVEESDLLAMLAELKSLSAEELQAQLAVEGEPVLEDDFA
ncbi:MAG TPA: amino acid adenylation domain-containing protein [Thermoanaerobaculia bacterium]|jgi:aspartate racemase|nr:amino acid adenylation domain-containing protein [Thermoanaerobaculia bacterium]